MGKPAPEGEPFDLGVLQSSVTELVICAVERKTGLAQTHRVARSLFESNDYLQFLRVHGQLVELAGTPAFQVRLPSPRADTSIRQV